MGKKQSIGCENKSVGKGVVGVPRWSSDEVLEVERGIAGCEKLSSKLTAELQEMSREKESFEVVLRRAQMTLCDR